MRLLVTGGAGCLGSEIVRHFGSTSEQVIVLDNLVTGNRSWLPERDNLVFEEGDVSDGESVEHAFHDYRPTHVVHAAASYANPDDWSGDLITNALGTLNVVKASEKAGVESFIYLQTALGYGRPVSTPIPITHALRPQTSYGISKVAGELYALGSELPQVFSFRLANICAPRLSIGPFPTFFKRIQAQDPCTVSDAERDFLDIDDFLALLELAFLSENTTKQSFNVSTGIGHSINDVYLAVERALGQSGGAPSLFPVGADDVKSVVLDASETEDFFGWSPRRSFDEVVGRQIQWFQDFGVGEIRSHLKNQNPKGKK